MGKITVIMPVWITDDETLALTEASIDSLGECFLIIVDNGSTVGIEYLQKIADEYIRNQKNLGYAKAVNQGLKIAKSRFVCISNNDIRVSPNWQEVAQTILESNPQAYSCHFRMIPYDELFDFPTDPQVFYEGRERWCTASFFVIDTLKKKFLFNEEYFNSYDDWDFFHRVRKFGFKTAYTEAICYQHKYSHTQALIPEREENDIKNRELFKKEWGEYAEDIFSKQYPEQMKQKYWDGFKLRNRHYETIQDL